jgi:hypothetical protein
VAVLDDSIAKKRPAEAGRVKPIRLTANVAGSVAPTQAASRSPRLPASAADGLLSTAFPFAKIPALEIGECRAHNSPMNKPHYDRADYSVVVKNRAPPPKAWRWEIYRAGNANPIKQSPIYFDTTAAAKRAGKDALEAL